jgi:hypothetical protein
MSLDPIISDLVQPLAHGLFGLASNPIANSYACKTAFGKKRLAQLLVD